MFSSVRAYYTYNTYARDPQANRSWYFIFQRFLRKWQRVDQSVAILARVTRVTDVAVGVVHAPRAPALLVALIFVGAAGGRRVQPLNYYREVLLYPARRV